MRIPDFLMISAISVAACRKSGDLATTPSRDGPACAAGFRGQIIASAISVDATDDAVYWEDYDAGTLQRQPRGGGAIETVMRWPAPHPTVSMRVGADAVFFTADDGVLYRLPLAGGDPEEVGAETSAILGPVEVVGDVAYAATRDGTLLWWRSAGEHGEIVVSYEPVALAASEDALYVGTARVILRITSPNITPEEVLTTRDPIDALAVAGERLYWREGERLMRRVGGEVSQITSSTEWATLLAPIAGGLLIGESNVIWFAADDLDGLMPVAITPAALTDLEVRGPSVFVGTEAGSVHELCIDPAVAVTLSEHPSCDTSSCTWYASGPLSSHDDFGDGGSNLGTNFYADGTVLGIYQDPDNFRRFFVDGTEGVMGEAWVGVSR